MNAVPLLLAALLAASAGSAWGLETAGDVVRAAGTLEHGDVRIVMAIKFARKLTTHMRILPTILANIIAQPNHPA